MGLHTNKVDKTSFILCILPQQSMLNLIQTSVLTSHKSNIFLVHCKLDYTSPSVGGALRSLKQLNKTDTDMEKTVAFM